MIVLHARIPVRPDKREDFLAAVPPVVSATREEEGNISYECFESTESQNLFIFVEQWQSQQALEAHTQTEHFKGLLTAMPDSVSGQPEIVTFESEGPQEVHF